MKEIYLQNYKGVWYGQYKYYSNTTESFWDTWVISDTEDLSGNVDYYSQKEYRLDQAIELFKKNHS